MRVAVFGAGYAGLTAARRLERNLPPEAELVVVDQHDYHLVLHEIHRAIRRPAVEDALRVPLSEVLDWATVREARVTDVDPEAGEATLDGEETLSYDAGIVALGSEAAFYDLPGVEEHATPLKSLDDAAAIRGEFLDAVEGGGETTVVVGGAGLSGVQTAGELTALAREEGVAEEVTVHLLEREAAVAPNFPENFQTAVHEALVDRGVTVRTLARVTGADEGTVSLDDGTEIDSDVFVWTGGIRGPDALGGERPVVEARLRHAGTTFVVGDAGRLVDADGSAVPAASQSAIRAAGVAAENVERLVEHGLAGEAGFEPRLETFQFDSPGWLVSVGDGAVAQVGGVVLTGAPAIALKTSIGAGHLTAVGAIEQAVGLVSEELDLATGASPDVDVPDDPVDVLDWNDDGDTDGGESRTDGGTETE